MKPMQIITLFCLLFTLICFNSCAQLNLDKLKKQGTEILNQNVPLTEEEVIKGLKEALTIGSQNSSTAASRIDAYFKNPRLFIPFPPEAQKIEATLTKFGQEKLIN